MCPNHLNLLFLIIKQTGSNCKSSLNSHHPNSSKETLQTIWLTDSAAINTCLTLTTRKSATVYRRFMWPVRWLWMLISRLQHWQRHVVRLYNIYQWSPLQSHTDTLASALTKTPSKVFLVKTCKKSNWTAPWKNRICSTTMKLRKSLVKPVTRQKTCIYNELFGSSARDRQAGRI